MLKLKTVDSTPFRWQWSEDPDIVMTLVPATPELERRVAKSSGHTLGSDGHQKVSSLAEHMIFKAKALIESWEGIVGPDGNALALTRENVQWVADQSPGLIKAVIDAAADRYAEIVELRGKSSSPSNGTSAGGSTASDGPLSETKSSTAASSPANVVTTPGGTPAGVV